MTKGGKRRQQQAAQESTTGSKRPRAQQWDKDEEEIDLEVKLFGTSRLKNVKSARGAEDYAVDVEMGGMEDDDVSLPFRGLWCGAYGLVVRGGCA